MLPAHLRTASRSWWARRLDPERSLGLRLTLASVAALLVLVPFASLGALAVASWRPLRRLDEGLAATLHAWALAHPGFSAAVQVWTDLFAPGPLRGLVLLVAAWLWWRGARRVALWAVVTMAAGAVLGVAFKLLFGRQRPDLLDPVAHAPGYSFPSGHALTAALAGGVLVLALRRCTGRVGVRRAMWAAAVLVTVLTGLSRVALGVHWMSDVLGGWILGAAVVVATSAAFATWHPRGPMRSGPRDRVSRPPCQSPS